ncbi:MAG: hypothetical protein K6V97_02885 [Actinomycetia bacterium]|nr:hypothetical protein [Actinomycetes bacterium]
MRDLLLVLGPRRRAWANDLRYWLRVLGADLRQADAVTRLYAVYLVALGAGWVVVAGSAVLALAGRIGGPLGPPAEAAGPLLLVLAAGAALTWDAARSPLLLGHGDLEWLGPSPVSRRALALPALLALGGRTLVVAGFAGVVLATGVHAAAPWPTGMLFGMWMVLARSLGWTVAALRWARRGRPRRGTWLLAPLGLAVLARLVPGAVWGPAAALAATVASGRVGGAAGELGGLALVAVLLAAAVAGRVNQVTVHEASGLYAAVQDLGTRYLPNPDLVRRLGQEARMARRRAWGRVPTQSPAFEPVRFLLGLVRRPEDAWVLLRLALLLRAGLIAVFVPHSGWSWLFWLLLAYRFPQGRLAYLFLRDLGDPFRRQFWMDDPARRWLAVSLTPLAAVVVAAFGLWLAWPADVPPRPDAALFLLALVLSWWLGEGLAALRRQDPGAGGPDAHAGALIASGLVLFAAAALHRPALGFVVPATLGGALLGRRAPASVPATPAADPGPDAPSERIRP